MGQTVAKSPKPPDDKSKKNEKSKKDKASGDLFAGLAAPPNGSGRRNGKAAPRGSAESGSWGTTACMTDVRAEAGWAAVTLTAMSLGFTVVQLDVIIVNQRRCQILEVLLAMASCRA